MQMVDMGIFVRSGVHDGLGRDDGRGIAFDVGIMGAMLLTSRPSSPLPLGMQIIELGKPMSSGLRDGLGRYVGIGVVFDGGIIGAMLLDCFPPIIQLCVKGIP